MLSNSIAAGTLATAYVLIVVMQLNPALPFDPARLGPLVTTVGLFYTVHLAVICYVLLAMRQLVGRELFSPAWLSIGVLVWLGALAAAGGAALMWANLYTFARVLDADTVRAMTEGAGTVAAAAVSFVLLARARRAFGGDARWPWAFALLLIAGLSIFIPAVLRGPGKVEPLEARSLDIATDYTLPGREARVNVIAIDGGSLDFIVRVTAEGRLPNFGRVLDSGAVMRLATIHPTSAEAVWAAALTGKLPLKNGVRSAGIYYLATGGDALQLLPNYCFAYQLVRFGFLVDRPDTSATLRTRALWSILSTHGFSVGAVGWPLTQPAPAVRGYVVSYTYLHFAGTPSAVVGSPVVYPSEAQEDVARAVESLAAETRSVVPASTAPLEDRHESAGRTDRTYDRIARELAEARQAQVTLTRYQSLDTIGHYFLRYAMPSEFGDALDDEHRALGPVLEQHYKVIDDAIGRAIASLGPDDVLLVVSGFGMEPMGLWKRLVEWAIGDPDLNGTHDAAPDGFLMAYGAAVARGRLPTRASVVDVTPTILYFLGLPIGRDMDGYARTDLFQRAFTDERPITFIPTYDR
jgi:predicted AlkP superfamily phosphohydrolase/phosphomutase